MRQTCGVEVTLRGHRRRQRVVRVAQGGHGVDVDRRRRHEANRQRARLQTGSDAPEVARERPEARLVRGDVTVEFLDRDLSAGEGLEVTWETLRRSPSSRRRG